MMMINNSNNETQNKNREKRSRTNGNLYFFIQQRTQITCTCQRLKPYDEPQHRPSLNPPPHNEPRDDNHVPPQQRLVQHHQNNHQHLNRPNQPQLPPPLTSLVHRPQNKDTTLQPNNPDDQYYVEKLLRYKSRDGKKFFRVKWLGHSERTWEPEENLPQIMVKEFLINKTQKGTARKKSSSCFRK